jgi:hypothetical protein
MPDQYEVMSDELFAALVHGEEQRARKRDMACDRHLDDLIGAYGVTGVPNSPDRRRAGVPA